MASTIPANEKQDRLVAEALKQAAEQALPYPTSRYHVRASPDSWTGLDQTRWGHDFYLASDDVTMGVRSVWEAESGVCHGLLMRCTWGGFEDRDRVPLPAAGVELRLTTPEGDELWLDDCLTTYAPGSDDFDFEGVEYGHRCGESCVQYLERYGWEDFRPGNTQWVEEEDLNQVEQDDEAFDELEGPEYMDQQVAKYSQNLLAAIPEEDEEYEKRAVLETIAEEDEDEDEGDESVIGLVSMGMLDRIAAAVHEGGAVLREIAAEMDRNRAQSETVVQPREEPLWMRDPTYVSGMRWSDMIDEEDDEY
jgi:hypothetical protein